MKTVTLPSGEPVPAIGLGTWRMGESGARRAAEVAAAREALDFGYRLIDTAEMYGDGGAEEVIGEALAGHPVGREQVFLVSKVYPHNASRSGVLAACARSRRRLRVERIDLYLLHWPGSVPIGETVDAFETLKARGEIGEWGVSNFDVAELEELAGVTGGERCAANQVYYSASHRGVEFELLPWQRARRIPTMAYSPIDQGALGGHRALTQIAGRHRATAAQVALAWLLRHPDVIVIPKAVDPRHLADNFAAASLTLTEEDLADIDRAFPPPRRKAPLAML
ncbi:MAG TPA: aldo/keto reductase [Burkholderiaceae bacterium]|nr:aldo/keto reductase [Burkholderiaceae bacterium]